MHAMDAPSLSAPVHQLKPHDGIFKPQIQPANIPMVREEEWSAWSNPQGWAIDSARHSLQNSGMIAGTFGVDAEKIQDDDGKKTGARGKKGDKKRLNGVTSEEKIAGLDVAKATRMRRVDWRWAAAKGFLNKDTNEWNEKMGGMKAYLAQRNDRMKARKTKAADAQIIRKRKEILKAKAIRAASHLYAEYDRSWANQINGLDALSSKTALAALQPGYNGQPPSTLRPDMSRGVVGIPSQSLSGAQVQQQQGMPGQGQNSQQRSGLPPYIQSQLGHHSALGQFPLNLQQGAGVLALQHQLIGGGQGVSQAFGGDPGFFGGGDIGHYGQTLSLGRMGGGMGHPSLMGAGQMHFDGSQQQQAMGNDIGIGSFLAGGGQLHNQGGQAMSMGQRQHLFDQHQHHQQQQNQQIQMLQQHLNTQAGWPNSGKV